VTDLAVDVLGDGDTVILVHGSGHRDWTWSDQLPLAERYRLVLPYRRGYGESPEADPDFAGDGADVADLLDRPSHLVGFSYGAIGAFLAAARRRELVRTIAAVEPPAFGVASDDPAVQTLVRRLAAVVARADELGPEEYGAAFAEAVGFERPPRPSPEMLSVLRSFQRERPPDEAEIPFGRIRGIPTLVVSGGWHPAFDAVCATIADRLGAELATFPGVGHGAQHAPGFNDRLLALWESPPASGMCG
jgi:pimeloyl-ACP methyl ester carboxylesterase